MAVPVYVAESCDECICAPLKEVCLFGPDSFGNFATAEVPVEQADTCDRTECTCASHEDYTETAKMRLESAAAVF